jgi:pimeloyl-ACP methyl ester carboxylesterase
MKKLLAVIAAIVNGIAIALAIDAGGHQLRMLIAGRGSPAVVFEAGGSGAEGAPLEMWERVQPAVSQFTRTVAYDRAGSGLSAPGPKPRDARQIARELHTALQNARVPPPYVLVGHSFGGPFIRVFAGLYPAEVCGMVLVDPTQEGFIAWNQTREQHHAERHDEEWNDIQTSLAEAHESHIPSGVPVVLITAMGPRVFPSFVTEKQKQEYKTVHQMWLKFHAEWLETVPNGQHLVTKNSGHGVPFEEPELVINAIRRMVEKVRTQEAPAPAPLAQ